MNGKLAAGLLCLGGVLAAAPQTRAQTMTCQGREILPLDFRNPTLVSGTALTTGAVYRFSTVAAGVDALVTITGISNAALTTIDRDTGLIANFQPELGIGAGNSNNPRSADFQIRLVQTGTSTLVTADFAASGVDIDGDSGSLREYAEFSSPIAEYALESPTRLDLNASGPSVPGDFRFESRTTFTAPGIDPTATESIVSAFYTNTSTFRYRIGSLGSGGTTRLTSLDFNCPNINFPSTTATVSQDFGDAPASYGDPIHDIRSGLRIGAANTAETAPYNSPTAAGDVGDDGATMPTFFAGETAIVDLSAIGAGGRLQAWVDFGRDGVFATAGDQVATNVVDGGNNDRDGAVNGRIRLAIPVPSTAVSGQSFLRFRWSTQTNLPPGTLTAHDGEVEDYAITIAAAPPAAVCPADQSPVAQTGNATAVTSQLGVANPTLALGAIAAAGSAPSTVSAELNALTDSLTLTLGASLPQNAQLLVSAARDAGTAGDTARVTVSFSQNGLTFTSAGSYGAPNATFRSGGQNTVEHALFTNPVLSARFVRFATQDGDDIFIDGVRYSQVCVNSTTISASKTVSVYDPTSANLLAVPGNDMIYTITASNTGNAATDANSVFVVDLLPSEIEFFNGDIDGAGPETGPVAFSQTGAGLTFNPSSDVRYSNSASPPANFAACAYTPVAGYDPAVRAVCFNPKGSLAAGNPDPSFTVRFRARIK